MIPSPLVIECVLPEILDSVVPSYLVIIPRYGTLVEPHFQQLLIISQPD
jgi:hypothetical protein